MFLDIAPDGHDEKLDARVNRNTKSIVDNKSAALDVVLEEDTDADAYMVRCRDIVSSLNNLRMTLEDSLDT